MTTMRYGVFRAILSERMVPHDVPAVWRWRQTQIFVRRFRQHYSQPTGAVPATGYESAHDFLAAVMANAARSAPSFEE